MPKPKLPNGQRKDVLLQVRFKESEMNLLIHQAGIKNCKTISQYIRNLIADDINLNEFDKYGMPQVQRRK
jgi:hypothetical protein